MSFSHFQFTKCFAAAVAFAAVGLSTASRAEQWTTPTPEELSMTAQAGAPGASAVYLFREETTVDHLHMYSEYVRLKVLTEGGKDRANIELRYATSGDMGYSVTDIAGRTIHPDGSIVPFTGKPYERVITKAQGYKEKEKVFTLPDVTVGSIIEYRYKVRWEDNMYSAPRWIVQNDLYLRNGHFSWFPTDRMLTSSDERGQLVSTVAWTPILPVGAEVKESKLPGGGRGEDGSSTIDLVVHDIPPSAYEDFMPPIAGFSYRVMFYFSPYRTPDEYWKGEGKHWAKLQDKFIGPNKGVAAAVQQIVGPSDTQEQKLKKIYVAVEKLNNTDFNREHSRKEDKAQGLSEVRTTDDVWAHQRGSSDQITELFVAMARAAGMKAYVMAVTNRDRSIFSKNYLSMYQLDDDIAIVNVDGKEHAFDPGSRYCPYGQLAWKHTDTAGLRENDGATALASTPGESYTTSQVIRVANLKMDDKGEAEGKIDLKFMGMPALKWRQQTLTEDRESVDRDMKHSVERMLPGGIDVKLLSIGKLEEYEEPLTASFQIKGPLGSATGKRLLLPDDIFEANSKPTFSHEKRELAIWFDYPYAARDAVRINLPASFQVESVPPSGDFKLPKMAAYKLSASADGTGITVRRDLYVAESMYASKDYSDMKTFYGQFEAKDQEPIILKAGSGAAQSGTSAGIVLDKTDEHTPR